MARLFILTLLALTTLHTTIAKTVSVYFGTNRQTGIFVAEFDQNTGQLSEPRKAADIPGAGFVAIHPSGKFLYSTTWNDGTGAVAAFRILNDQSLELINVQSSRGNGSCHVSLNASGSTLFTANYGGGNVSSFYVNSDGSLSEATSTFQHSGSGTHENRQKEPHPHSIFPNPSGTHAYVPDLGIDEVVIYKVDQETATLIPSSTAKIPGGAQGPRHLKFSSDGKNVYVLNELSLNLAHFTSENEESGALKLNSQTSLLEEGKDLSNLSGSEVRIHPNQRFLYTAQRDHRGESRDTISLFYTIDTAAPELVQSFPAEVAVPRNFNLSPDGRWMLVAGQNSKNVAVFSINPENGFLKFTGHKVKLPASPICVAFCETE